MSDAIEETPNRIEFDMWKRGVARDVCRRLHKKMGAVAVMVSHRLYRDFIGISIVTNKGFTQYHVGLLEQAASNPDDWADCVAEKLLANIDRRAA